MDSSKQKQIVVSIDNWRKLKLMGHMGMVMDKVITELVNMKMNMNMKQNAIRSEQTLEGETHPISSTTVKEGGPANTDG